VPNINNSGYALLDFLRIENNRPVAAIQRTSRNTLADPIGCAGGGAAGYALLVQLASLAGGHEEQQPSKRRPSCWAVSILYHFVAVGINER
jgi:hypothetical protein